jgi:glutathione S-transferase
LLRYIGDKNDSSWSLRPWLLVKRFGIAVEERRVPIGRGAAPSREVGADIDRIVSIWTEAREQFAPLAAMLDHPAMREWKRDALAEGVSLPYDDAAARWGGPR